LYLEEKVRSMLDVEALRKCPMDLTIGVADLKGNPILCKARDYPDPALVAAASSALFPVVPGKMINGVYCVDGGFTVKSSVRRWLVQILRSIPARQEVDLLFLANRPHPMYEDWIEEIIFHLIAKLFLRNYPGLLEGALSVAPKLAALADRFEKREEREGKAKRRIRMCALYPMLDENIYPNEWRRSVFDTRGDLSRMRFERFLKAVKPAVWV
jgi:hypothetical protein